MDNPKLPKEFVDFVKSRRVASVATISSKESHRPQLAVVYYYFDGDLRMFWGTSAEAMNLQNIKSHDKAAMIIINERELKSVEVEGTAKMVTDLNLKQDLITKLAEVANLQENFALPPLTKIPHTTVEIVMFTIDWFKYLDFYGGHAYIFEGAPGRWDFKKMKNPFK